MYKSRPVNPQSEPISPPFDSTLGDMRVSSALPVFAALLAGVIASALPPAQDLEARWCAYGTVSYMMWLSLMLYRAFRS